MQQLYGQVVIPAAVAEELKRGGQEDARINQALSLAWIEVRQPIDRTLVETLKTDHNLDRGEAEAIALALELSADELLIDERLGRREAMRLGLSITGLLGVLLVAKRQGLLTAIRPVLDVLLTEAGFRVSSQLYPEVLIAAGESCE
nr:DUF3368 domain-containing protein [Leptolyngbya sp. FACHB-671]